MSSTAHTFTPVDDEFIYVEAQLPPGWSSFTAYETIISMGITLPPYTRSILIQPIHALRWAPHPIIPRINPSRICFQLAVNEYMLVEGLEAIRWLTFWGESAAPGTRVRFYFSEGDVARPLQVFR